MKELHSKKLSFQDGGQRITLNSSNQQEILNYAKNINHLVPERFEFPIWFESPVRLTHLEFVKESIVLSKDMKHSSINLATLPS